MDMAGAFEFFSSCWTCGMFADIIGILSDMLPKVYYAIGLIILPVTVGLTVVWLAWRILAGYIGAGEREDAWKLSGWLGSHVLKMGIVAVLLVAPLPRLFTKVAIEPVFNVSLSVGRAVDSAAQPSDVNSFESCVIATALSDVSDPDGAFSPKLRHNLACQLAGIHQMTGLGMTAGWTMLQMSFDHHYMHKPFFGIPLFPNVILSIGGFIILILFFFALLPVPIYILEVFVKLAMDLVMLPLMLLSWLFKGWKIFPEGTGNLMEMLNDVIKNIAGIALLIIFVAFSSIFVTSMFGSSESVQTIGRAIEENNAHIFMDGLIMSGDGSGSIVTVILIGVFLAMFMTMIPQLIDELFKNVGIPKEYYNETEKWVKGKYDWVKNWQKSLKKKDEKS
jgi:hypothetical protein